MRYTYCGEEVYWLWPTSFQEGFDDGLFYLPRHDNSNLYRYPAWKKTAWRLGYWLGRFSKWLGNLSARKAPAEPKEGGRP